MRSRVGAVKSLSPVECFRSASNVRCRPEGENAVTLAKRCRIADVYRCRQTTSTGNLRQTGRDVAVIKTIIRKCIYIDEGSRGTDVVRSETWQGNVIRVTRASPRGGMRMATNKHGSGWPNTKQSSDEVRWLTVEEAANQLGISVQATRKLYERGTLIGARRRDERNGGHSRIWIVSASVDRYLSSPNYANRTRKGTQ